MAVRREDTMWDDAMLANLREIAEGGDLPAADRPARIVAYALLCADMTRNGKAWPYDCAQAGRIAVQALQFAGMLPAPTNSEAAQAAESAAHEGRRCDQPSMSEPVPPAAP